MTLAIGSLHLGLIYGLMALGIYISFKLLDIPDLTADGSFTLGLAVSAVMTTAGHPFLAMVAAIIAGCIAGSITGFLQTKMKIHPILASIITMSGLYSVNLFIMGASSNVSLIGKDTMFTIIRNNLQGMDYNLIKSAIAIFLSLALWGLLSLFFKTYIGLSIRATGNNEDMVRSSSINVDAVKTIALAIANGCIALSGAVIAQFQGYADISSGVGILVIGLASVIIGEVFMGHRSVTLGLLSAIIGSTIYRLIIALALSSNVFPAYGLKLVSAIIVGVALSIPAIKEHMEFYRTRREDRKNA